MVKLSGFELICLGVGILLTGVILMYFGEGYGYTLLNSSIGLISFGLAAKMVDILNYLYDKETQDETKL